MRVCPAVPLCSQPGISLFWSMAAALHLSAKPGGARPHDCLMAFLPLAPTVILSHWQHARGLSPLRENWPFQSVSSFMCLSSMQVTTDLRQRCTDGHTGTSVSAPMVAGIIALALEAK